MEPIKNTNLNTGMNGANGMGGPSNMGNGMGGTNNESAESAFRGMPKPGQPLTATPRVNANPAPTPTMHSAVPQTPATPAHNPTFSEIMSSNSMVNGAAKPSAPANLPTGSASSFSYSPSALDRLMNPSIDKQPATPASPVASTLASAPKPVAPMSSSFAPGSTQVSAPAPSPIPAPAQSSTFKPYTPPTPPVQPVQTQPSVSSILNSTSPAPSQSSYTAQSAFTSAPQPITHNTSTPPTSKPYSPSYSGTVPPAPSANVTAAKLNSEVNAMLNNNQTPAKKSNGNVAAIIGLVALLLLLGGGGYYWYTYMYLPNKANTEEVVDDNTFGQPTNTNTSSFPTSATKPTATQPTNPTVTTPAKPTRVITPFTQAQRRAVTAYLVANINNLAPRAEGPYEVTDVTFDGPDRAVVQYTNGTYSYTAIAVASIDSANNVSIVSFSPLEK